MLQLHKEREMCVLLTINTLRSVIEKVTQIVRVLSKYKNERSIDGMFVFEILVRTLNCISKSARENCVRPCPEFLLTVLD